MSQSGGTLQSRCSHLRLCQTAQRSLYPAQKEESEAGSVISWHDSDLMRGTHLCQSLHQQYKQSQMQQAIIQALLLSVKMQDLAERHQLVIALIIPGSWADILRRSPFSAPERSSCVPSGGYTATRLWSRSAGVISLEDSRQGGKQSRCEHCGGLDEKDVARHAGGGHHFNIMDLTDTFWRSPGSIL